VAPLRIVHILPSIQGYGAERQIVELCRQLASPDVDVALLTIYEPPENAKAALPFPVAHAGRKSRADLGFFVRLIREIKRMRPDVVHTHTHVGKYWGRCAAIIARVPVVVHTEHNPCDPRRTGFERFADRILHRATACVVTFFREQGTCLNVVEHLPPEKTVIIPNGLEMTSAVDGEREEGRARLGVGNDRFAVLHVGRMEFQKNQILALRALSVLPADLRERVVLFFAGSGSDEMMLRGFSRAIGVAENVRFLGYRNDVPTLLAGADLLLMTSWFEGMPLALIEAMNAGVPIVTTPWMGARNMLGDGCYGFLAADYEPLHVAAEMTRALTRPAARVTVAERARTQAHREYGIARMVDAHRKLYRELCGVA